MMKRGIPGKFFDVASPHRRVRTPFVYRFPLLAKLRLKGHRHGTRRVLYYSGGFALFTLLLLSLQVPSLLANVRTFLPATCSGDWSNASALIEDNPYTAAVATAPGQKVFCSFASLNLKESVPLERAMVSLTFETRDSVTPNASTGPAAEAPATEESSPAEAENSVSEQESAQGPETEPEVTEIPSEEPEPPAPEAPQEETTPPAQEEAPTAFLFGKVAHAQETETLTEEQEPVEEPQAAELPPPEDVSEPGSSIPTETPLLEASSDEAEPEVGSEEDPADETEQGTQETGVSRVTLSYTTDGVLWTDVSTFAPRSREVTFDLAVPTTADFERLVIRLTSEEMEEEITLSHLEIKLWTEAPLDTLLKPVDVAPGTYVFTGEFTIDPDATHYCVFEPLVVDLSAATSTAFSVSLKKGENVGEGIDDVLAHASDVLLEVLAPESAGTTSAEEVVSEVEEIASSTDVVVTTPSSIEETTSPEESVVEAVFAPVVEAVEQLSRIRVGTLEMGSLPRGIDIRFEGESPYRIELFDDSQEVYALAAQVFDPENAQEGSFSVPLVFTRTDGGESTVVCQINIINRPGSGMISEPETLTEPSV